MKRKLNTKDTEIALFLATTNNKKIKYNGDLPNIYIDDLDKAAIILLELKKDLKIISNKSYSDENYFNFEEQDINDLEGYVSEDSGSYPNQSNELFAPYNHLYNYSEDIHASWQDPASNIMTYFANTLEGYASEDSGSYL